MAAINPRETPYKGLVPYAESDYRLFFGRDVERDIITANIMGSRLTLVYGPSGVGKSSVLRAGVVHGIREMTRKGVATPGAANFIVVFFNEWRDDPLTGLRNEIRRSVREAVGDTPSLTQNLSFADELKHWAKIVGGKLLIILDQFEEYFLYPQKEGEGSFAHEFPMALSRSDVRTNFIVSLREDWYTKLDRFKISIPHLFDNNLRVDWLNREGARRAIEEPIKVYNEELKNGSPRVKIDPGFATAVLNQLEALAERNVLGDSGSGEVKGSKLKGSIQTPYLQLVMSQLWSEAIAQEDPKLDPSMLDAPVSGDRERTRSEEIIQSHLDSVMKTLSPEEQDIAARAFYHLVTPGGTKIAQQIGDLADYTSLSESTLDPVLRKLSSKEMSILTQLIPPPNKAANQVRYELFHDVLAHAILNWRGRFNAEQAKAKAKAEAKFKLEQERAEAAKQAAQKEAELKAAEERAEMERQRAEDQKARLEAELIARQAQEERAETERIRAEEHFKTSKRLRRLTWGLAVMVLISLGAGVVAVLMGLKARENARIAKLGRIDAEVNERIALANEQRAIRYAAESEEERIAADAAEARAKEMKELAEIRLKDANHAKVAASAAEARATTARAAAEKASAEAQRLEGEAAANLEKAEAAQRDARAQQRLTQQAQSVNFLYQNALIAYRNKDYESTIGALTMALPLIESNSSDLAYAHTLIGNSYADLDEPTKAVESYNRALEIFRSRKESTGVFYSLENIGDAYSLMEGGPNKELAAQFYSDATAGYEKAGGFLEVAQVHVKVAKLYKDSTDKADREKMIAAYRRAIDAYQKAGDSETAASTFVILGDFYANADDPFDSRFIAEPYKAEAEYRNALKIYKEQNSSEQVAAMLVKIAELFEDSEDRKKSYEAYAEAAKIYLDINKHREAGTAFSRLGVLHRRQQNPTLAQENYEKAAKAFEHAGDFASAARALLSAGLINDCSNCDNAKRRTAAGFFRKSVALYERVKNLSTADNRNLRLSLTSIITIYNGLGEKTLAAEYQKKYEALRAVPE